MIRVTLKDGTILEVGEGFSYTVGEVAGEPIILSAETIDTIIMPAGFGVTDARTPAGENGQQEPIKVLVLEDRDSGLRVHVPLSLLGAMRLAADLVGYDEAEGSSLALPDEGIQIAQPGDLSKLPPPELLG